MRKRIRKKLDLSSIGNNNFIVALIPQCFEAINSTPCIEAINNTCNPASPVCVQKFGYLSSITMHNNTNRDTAPTRHTHHTAHKTPQRHNKTHHTPHHTIYTAIHTYTSIHTHTHPYTVRTSQQRVHVVDVAPLLHYCVHLGNVVHHERHLMIRSV